MVINNSWGGGGGGGGDIGEAHIMLILSHYEYSVQNVNCISRFYELGVFLSHTIFIPIFISCYYSTFFVLLSPVISPQLQRMRIPSMSI